MIIKTFNESKDIEKVYGFYNKNAKLINYLEFKTINEFKHHVIDDDNFEGDGCFLAQENDDIIGIICCVIKKDLLPDETYESSPGYICIFFVDEQYQNQGIGTKLLNKGIEYFWEKGKTKIQVNHKCPIKFAWRIDNTDAQHNKTPGVKTNMKGYEFFKHHGFHVDSYELSYYLDLAKFSFDEKMRVIQERLQLEGYTVGYFDEAKHTGYDEMFTRLNDESYRKKFSDDLKRNADILVLLKDDYTVCGIAGEIYAEANGRGFFQGLAVDPEHSGKKLGNLLFYRLCEELKNKGADYMTLFVTEDNFAKKIYEKAGFEVVQRWAVLNMQKGE